MHGKERLSILKSCISYDDHSTAGLLIRSDKFKSITAYAEFTAELTIYLQSHSTLGATHSILKISFSLM